MQIRAIETRYAGYRFRSRLEAKWAVFFDSLEPPIVWDYEQEGYEIPTSLGTMRYLVDFWLQSTRQWAEVKGFLNMDGMRKMHAIAVSLTQCRKGTDLVIFGNIQRQHSAAWPVQLHAHEDRLWAVAWDPYSAGCAIKRPRVLVEPTMEMCEHLTQGFPFGVPEWAEEALEAARQARFEWGEQGARRKLRPGKEVRRAACGAAADSRSHYCLRSYHSYRCRSYLHRS
jgi:hypothetical protein